MSAWTRGILETGMALAFVGAPAAFGAVPSWAWTSLAAWLFFLLFLRPQAGLEILHLPRFFLWGMLVVFGWIFVQAFFFSLNRYATAAEILKWLALAAAFLILQGLPKTSLARLSGVLLIVAFADCLYGFFETSSGREMVLGRVKEFHRGFVTGTYMNRNHFAGLMELSLGVALGFLLSALRQGERLKALAIGAVLLVLMTGLFKSGSRWGAASFFLSLSLFLSFLLAARKRQSIRPFVLFIGGLAFISFLVAGGTLIFRLTGEADYELAHSRPVVWSDTLRLIQRYPWQGIGLGSFAWVFPGFQSERLQMGWDHAHNDYLELASELGLPAALLLFVSFGSLVWKGCRALPRLDTQTFRRVWGMLVALTSLALHGLADFNFAIPANALLVISLFSMMLRLIREETRAL